VSKLSAADAYLVVKTVSVGRGRPSRSYEISPLIRAHLNGCSKLTCPPMCMQVVEDLLSIPTERKSLPGGGGEGVARKVIGYQHPPVRKKSDQLTLANRWLLAVLVSHASELGVVQGLGLSTLRQLTGMGEARLKTQLLRLVELGLIRSHVPGISSLLFAGTKVSTTYFLNLNHPFLGVRSTGSAVLVFHEYGGDRREAVCVTARPVVERYFRQLSEEAFNIFYLRLDGYASFLLSSNWAGSGRSVCPELRQALQDLIFSDFQRPEGRSAAGLDIDEADWVAVVDHFCWLALERGRWIKDLLLRMPSGDLGETHIQIIPTPTQDDGTQVTTLLLEHTPVPPVNCLVIRYTSPAVCELYGEESELSAEERYRFGLQARPKGRERSFFTALADPLSHRGACSCESSV